MKTWRVVVFTFRNAWIYFGYVTSRFLLSFNWLSASFGVSCHAPQIILSTLGVRDSPPTHRPPDTTERPSLSFSLSLSLSLSLSQTIVSSSLAYPIVFSMTCPLGTVISLSVMATSPAPSSASAEGKYIRPSLTIQPRCWANSTTLPSLSRKRRFLALVMGKEG